MKKRISNLRIYLQTLVFGIVILITMLIWTLKDSRLAKLTNHVLHSSLSEASCPEIDWSNPTFCTVSNNNTLLNGSAFNISSNLLRQIGMPLLDFEVLQRKTLDDFVFVTAANARYFHFAMDAIGNVQNLFPNHSIYFYDLSVKDICQNLTSKIESLCNVNHRKFNFSRYPSHLRFLKSCAFKPVILQEMLMEFPRIFWIDSSVRFKTGNLSLTLDEVYANGGILTFYRSTHSNFEVTHSEMYRFLPILASDASSTVQYGAGSIYIHRNEIIYNRIIAWWVLCALENDCISPTLQWKCSFKGSSAKWAGCHRFDQAALNILMAHHFKYDVMKYTSRHSQVEIRRCEAHKYQLSICPDRRLVNSSDYFSKR